MHIRGGGLLSPSPPIIINKMNEETKEEVEIEEDDSSGVIELTEVSNEEDKKIEEDLNDKHEIDFNKEEITVDETPTIIGIEKQGMSADSFKIAEEIFYKKTEEQEKVVEKGKNKEKVKSEKQKSDIYKIKSLVFDFPLQRDERYKVLIQNTHDFLGKARAFLICKKVLEHAILKSTEEDITIKLKKLLEDTNKVNNLEYSYHLFMTSKFNKGFFKHRIIMIVRDNLEIINKIIYYVSLFQPSSQKAIPVGALGIPLETHSEHASDFFSEPPE